jgi:hypothetical protein
MQTLPAEWKKEQPSLRLLKRQQSPSLSNYRPTAVLNDFSKAIAFALKSTDPVRCFSALNSVVLVRKRTIQTERPQPVGEVSANFS